MYGLAERLRGRFARQALEIYLFQGMALLAGLAGSVLIARSLGPEGKGTLDLFVLLTTMVVQFGMLGISAGYVYELANRHRPISHVHGDAVVVAVGLGGTGLMLGVFLSDAFGRLLGDLDPSYAAIALAATGFLTYIQSFGSLMTGTDRAPLAYRTRAVFAASHTAFVLVFWILGWLTVEAMVILLAVSWIVQAVVSSFITSAAHRSERLSPSRTGIASSLKYGLRVYPSTIANWLHYRIDQLVIAHMLGASSVGVYAVSVRWAELLWILGFGLLNAGLFRIASSERDDSRGFTWRLFKLTIAVSSVAGLALALVAAPLVRFLYGMEFEDAIVPMLILIPGVVLWNGGRVLSNFIGFNLGRPQLPTTIAVCAVIINGVATVVVVPLYGLNAAALTSTLTYALVMLATFVLFRRLTT